MSTVTVLKKTLSKQDQIKRGNYVSEKKTTGGKNSQVKPDANMKKLDDAVVPQVATITHELAQKIQQARTAKNLTQMQLAQSSQVPLSVIQKYENQNSKVVVESSVLSKLTRVLGVVFKKPEINKVKEDQE